MLKWLLRLFVLVGLGGLAVIVGGLVLLWEYGRGLPDYQQLADYQLPTTSRIYAGDGRLLAEYATERRIFVPITAIPPRVIQAFVAAEDQHFFTHPGVDPMGMARAVIQNIQNYGKGRRPEGASTITQQVARNFLLTNEVSISRKVKEAILAFRIEQALSKDRILELYLNGIYLGAGSYGVASAAQIYFNKPLADLTLNEAAYLAGLPKGPSNYDPVRNPERAKERRDYVIDRMRDEQFITAAEAAQAESEAIVTRKRDPDQVARADYFAEEVRRDLVQRYGENGLYKGGLSVRTTLDPHLQQIVDKAFRKGLITYDRRHGWRGPLADGSTGDAKQRLAATPLPAGAGDWQLAAVTKIEEQSADILLKSGGTGRIPMSELSWARKELPDQHVGATPKKPADVLAAGDIVLVEPVAQSADGKVKYPAATYALRQIPEVSGGVVAMDPHTGRVLALTGGLSFELSQFDRAVQAMRQPGSSFKPFVYMAALDNGYTPSTLILDAPFVIDQGPGIGKWRPENYEVNYLGMATLRTAIEHSRNLMTVRTAEAIGMDKVADMAEKFGVVDKLPRYLSMSLGAGETTLIRMTNAYSMIVNGGKRVHPILIDRVQDRNGKTIYRADDRVCEGCNAPQYDGGAAPVLADNRPQIEDPATCYQMVSILEGVVQRGTGAMIGASIKRPLAGKTGTTSDATDAWFVGFSPDLAVGVYVAFDQPRTLGPGEQGSRVSAPIFRDVMQDALAGTPAIPFRIPPGVRLVRVDAQSGQPAGPGDTKAIFEAFKPGTEPGSGNDKYVGTGTTTTAPGATVPAHAVSGGLY
jgi:penicillin-binding protein 1A